VSRTSWRASGIYQASFCDARFAATRPAHTAGWFAEAAKRVANEPIANLKAYWLERGWPDDMTFSTRLIDFAIYKREPRKAELILQTLESYLSPKEPVDFSSLQIEHILPQTIKDDADGKAWKVSLGPNWKSIHERRLHTLPNLTLSGYNPELSNRAFASKRQEYTRSNLRLTREISDVNDWNEEAMRSRGERLVVTCLNLWPRPSGAEGYTPVSDLGLLESGPGNSGASAEGHGAYIVATLNWTEAGRNLPTEVIADEVVAKTMATFLGVIIRVIGAEAAKQLAGMRVSRGPLLSTEPSRDFANPSTGKPYGHRRVPDTPFFVLTHSGTPEKLSQMRAAADAVGLPPKAVTINFAKELPSQPSLWQDSST
jgi:hypothetical protein